MPEIGPDTRSENLERLEREAFDVCIVGGGITGAGVALDAASRGLSVALVERDDFASGTSSRSSKMVHGGLRYLAQYDFKLTWEASRERDLLRRLAPHLVRPLRFLFPAYKKGIQTRFATIGLSIYDVVAGRHGFGRHKRARADDVRRLAPTLDPKRVVGAWTYWDATTDDARLVFEVLRTAHGFGAVIANHVRVHGFDTSKGSVSAALVTDESSGREITVRARCFVNAAGVWADEVGRLEPRSVAPPIRPAKGIHLVVPRSTLPVRSGVIIPSVARDRRSLFCIPGWGDTVVIGTTDTTYDGPRDAPAVDDDDVRYALDAVNWSLGLEVEPSDVVSAWAGLRPLLAGAGGPDERTADLSRTQHLSVSPAGLLTITGGKLTTYRRMAADTVDLVCSRLGIRARSRTKRLPIGLTRPLDGLRAETIAGARAASIGEDVAAHLVETFGDRAPAVLELAASDAELAEPLVPGLPWIGAEAVWAVDREMATGLSDVLERRTRLSLADRDAGLASAAPRLVGNRLGIGPAIASQLATIASNVTRERGPVARPLAGETTGSEASSGSARVAQPGI
ncbi:MAG TPA: glycerol-3-phosphate dehydrogenase/oxidase [Actinomycetota bacterium]|nr:glycerol-3-phosphate dehydrogenase/oxidase [Actinomycetota bacterium]